MKSTDNALKKIDKGIMGTHTLALQALKPVSEAALAGPFMQLFTLVYVKFLFYPL